MPSNRRKEVEDPDNTWNSQLMAAVLATDLAACEDLVAKGADPVNAREPTAFTNGGRVSPLAALLLRGALTDDALAVARYLMQCGARVDDVMPLPTPPSPSAAASTMAGGEEAFKQRLNGGAAAAPTMTSAGERGDRKLQRSPSRVGGMGAAPVAAVSPTAADVSSTAGAPAIAAGRVRQTPREVEAALAASDCGTLLHYVVALGDHAHLLQLLMVLAEHKPSSPPQSLLPEVELEMALPPPPLTLQQQLEAQSKVTSPSRASSRGGRSRSRAASMSRRQSRSPGMERRAQHEAELAAAAAARRPLVPSPLPLLEQYPYKPLPCVTVDDGDGAVDETATPSAALSATSPTQQARPQLPQLSRDPIRLLPLSGPGDGVAPSAAATTASLEVRTTKSHQTALEMAVHKKDTLAVRLLTYYGAQGFAVNPSPSAVDTVKNATGSAGGADAEEESVCVNGYVNGSQTLLARACARGDVASMEFLLDAGDSLSQLSHDGRYTLIHYAVGQPLALQYLVRRGLSGNAENAYGETALVSLIRHGTGRNADHACKEAPCMGDAAKLAALPTCALRNYILTPLPPLVVVPGGRGNNGGGATAAASAAGGGGSSLGRASISAAAGRSLSKAAGSGRGSQHLTPRELAAEEMARQTPAERNVIGGGGETGSWFSFTSLPTADLIHNVLLHAGANVNGFVPDDELDLAYVQFAEDTARGGAGCGAPAEDGQLLYASKGPAAVSGGVRSPSPILPSSSSLRNNGRASQSMLRKASAAAWSEYNGNSLRESLAGLLPAGATPVKSTAYAQPARLPLRAPPLIHAITNYHPELIRKLVVEYRADIMCRDSQGACALHYAAQCPHPSVMELFLSPLVLGIVSASAAATTAANASLATSASTGGTAAGAGGNSGGAAAPPVPASIDLNACDMEGRTPLHYAAAIGNTPLLKLLLAMGTTVNAGMPDRSGRTPLHLAVLANSTSCVEALVRHSETVLSALCGVNGAGAGSGLSSSGKRQLQQHGGSGSGALSSSPQSTNNSSIGRQRRGSALSRNSNVSNVSHHQPNDGFGAAGAAGLNELAVVDTEAEDFVEHATALEMAIKKKADPSLVRLLMSEGSASFRRPSGLAGGGSLLHRAVADDALEYVTLLLEHYADPNEADENDHTPLMLAVDRPRGTVQAGVVEALLRFGALPNAQSVVTLRTPLHAAAERGHSEEVLSLLFFELSDVSAGAAGSPRTPSTRVLDDSRISVKAASPLSGADGTAAVGGVVARRLKDRLAERERAATAAAVADDDHKALATENEEPAVCAADASRPASLLDREGNSECGGGSVAVGAEPPEQQRANVRRLIAEPYFLLADHRGRTPLHLLCSQTDAEAQAAALPILKAILPCRRPSGPGAATSAGRNPAEAAARRSDSLPSSHTPTFHDQTLSLPRVSDAVAGNGSPSPVAMAPAALPFELKLCLFSDAAGRLPIHDACRAIFADAVELLLATVPASVFSVTGDVGSTPLHEAVAACHYSVHDDFSSRLMCFAQRDGSVDADVRQRNMTAVFNAITRAVQACTPATLNGYAAHTTSSSHHHAASSVCGKSASYHNGLSRGSITRQLQNSRPMFTSRSKGGAAAAAVMTGRDQVLVPSLAAYLQLTDNHGRTPLLLAGELGDVAASTLLMKLHANAAAPSVTAL